MRILTAALLALWVPSVTLAGDGPTLVTLGGDLSAGDLPARGADDGGLFGHLEITFARGMAFDAGALAALAQSSLSVPFGPPDAQSQYDFSGPRLSDVMAQANATGKTAVPVAIDGYRKEIPWDRIERFEPILATHANGAPLPLGGYGPAVIVFPTVEDPDLAQELGSYQVWATAYIGIE